MLGHDKDKSSFLNTFNPFIKPAFHAGVFNLIIMTMKNILFLFVFPFFWVVTPVQQKNQFGPNHPMKRSPGPVGGGREMLLIRKILNEN